MGWVVKDASLLAKIRQVLSICFPINNKTAIYQVTVEEPTEILQINHLEGVKNFNLFVGFPSFRAI